MFIIGSLLRHDHPPRLRRSDPRHSPGLISRLTRAATWRPCCWPSSWAAVPASLGGDLFLAFLCSVAFATILAVVSGLVLAASAAIAHDIYVNVIKDGHADQHEQVRAARITSLVVGAIGIVIGITAEKENVAHLVALAFAVASSGNLPVVVLSLFWKRFNTAGVISGLLVGTISAHRPGDGIPEHDLSARRSPLTRRRSS